MADNDTFRYLGGLALKGFLAYMCDWVCTTWEETGPERADLGLSWPTRGGPFSGHFWGHFWDPFLVPFWSTFGPQNGSQNGPKTVPKLDFFEVYFWTSFLEGFGALSGPSGSLLGSLEALLGRLWIPKTYKKWRFFEVFGNGTFCVFEALDGPLGLILRPSWAH